MKYLWAIFLLSLFAMIRHGSGLGLGLGLDLGAGGANVPFYTDTPLSTGDDITLSTGDDVTLGA